MHTLDVNLQLGPGLERHVLERDIERDSIRYGVRDSAELHALLRRRPVGLFDGIINESSSLGLTRVQIVSIDSLTKIHETRREAAYGALAQFLATAGQTVNFDVIHEHWLHARVTVQTSEAREGMALRHVLTTDQLETVRHQGNGLFSGAVRAEDDRELQRILSLWRRPPLP